MSRNMTKTIHALLPYFFENHVKIVNSIPELQEHKGIKSNEIIF